MFDMKKIKNTRKAKPAMTPETMKRLRLEMGYDLVSLGQLLEVPYRTLQDREAGKRSIPASFAAALIAAHKADRRYMNNLGKRLDADFDRLYPHGIMSEINNSFDE